MSDQPTEKPATIPPDHVVIEKPTTARELFLMAVRGNPGNLATAVNCKPGETYTLNINISLNFTREDTLAMLREGGYTIDFPNAANDGKETTQ